MLSEQVRSKLALALVGVVGVTIKGLELEHNADAPTVLLACIREQSISQLSPGKEIIEIFKYAYFLFTS